MKSIAILIADIPLSLLEWMNRNKVVMDMKRHFTERIIWLAVTGICGDDICVYFYSCKARNLLGRG